MTILSSIRLDGETESLIFEGAVDRKMFGAYIKEGLAPTLRLGDIVVMDSLSAHKSQDACNVIRKRQGKCFFPAYSQDFNPIGKMWSKVKQILREIKPRTEELLAAAAAAALNAVTVDDARAGLIHMDIQRFKVKMLWGWRHPPKSRERNDSNQHQCPESRRAGGWG